MIPARVPGRPPRQSRSTSSTLSTRTWQTLDAPRIEVARLTVRQHANAVTDLLATFLGDAKPEEQPGLAGRYYKEKGFGRDKLIIDRTDPQVEFTFGDKSPDPEKIGAEEFSIQWQGGVLAEETGDYEFILKTENGIGCGSTISTSR